MFDQELHEGVITRTQSGFMTIRSDAGIVTCQLRGKVKNSHIRSDLIAVGDRIQFTLQSEGKGMVENILPRTRMLVRLDPTPHGIYRQIMLANLDQLILIFACADPFPHLRMLDRFLVIAEKQEIPVAIVFNKIDLIGLEKAKANFSFYEEIGYPVLYTSVKQKIGLYELRNRLIGKLTAFSGPSGVGKSSLLNSIQDGLGVAARDVSSQTGKGRHTTVVREMYALDDGGYVVDTPGLKSLALWDTQPEELDGYFPEIRDLVAGCAFSDCTHRSEPGCAVKTAVEEGRVYPARYESYLRLRYGE
jgi:ribosome biogenesis GTPase / thiamine phosphate phosphatase